MENKPMTMITFLSIILFCSSGYNFEYCPYESGNESPSSTACNSNYYDCNVFNRKILDYENQLRPFFEKVKSKEVLSPGEVEVATKIANEYYTYLLNKKIVYGELARDVVNDHGAFARLANNHLKHRAEIEGKSDQVESIENNLRVALAYSDAKLRSECKEFVPYKAIAKYHYDMFEHQGLSKYAWGGTLLEEFAGSGSWMNVGGYDKKVDFTPMKLMKALIISNKEVNDIKAREALKSLKHVPLEHLGDSLLASTYRTLLTYEPIYEKLKKHHNSFFAPDGHMYNFEEYKTEVLDKMFALHENQKQTDSLEHEGKESNDDCDHTENDDDEDFSNPDLNVKFVKVVNLGSTIVIKQIVNRLKNGNIIVIWCTHEDTNYSNMKTYLQIYSQEGNKLKDPLNIPFTSFDLKLESLSNGGFIIYSTDVFNIYNANADLIINGRFTPCFINYRCFRQHVTSMKNGQFLSTWHESTETRSVTFKGQYYNIKGNTTSKEFVIYHGTKNGLCKLSTVDDDYVGIICKDRGSSDESLNNAATDFLACVDYVPESVNCFSTMATIDISHLEKKRWKKLPMSYSTEPPEILNLGHRNFVVLIEQLQAEKIQQINALVIADDTLQNTIKIENDDKKYEVLLKKLTDEVFLITWRDYDGHHIESIKYNINGQMLGKELSIVTKGSNHHFETYGDELGFVISWMNSRHMNHEIQKWHHFEHGYSGAWSNHQELNTTILMLIKNNYSNAGFVEYIIQFWNSLD